MNTQAETPTRNPESDLIGYVLSLRGKDFGKGSLAAIRAGIVPATEVQAFPFTEARLAGLNEASKAGTRRAAAICALHKGVKQFDGKSDSNGAAGSRVRTYQPLGTSLRLLHSRRGVADFKPGDFDSKGNPKRSGITMQIDSLPLLPMEEAAQVFNLLIGRCASEGVAVDFYNLARTLSRWGNGITPASRAVRNRIVQDFYGSSDSKSQ